MTESLAARDYNGVTIPTAGTYVLDANHKRVGFVARHLMVSKVRGEFLTAEATITIAEDPLQSSVTATIQTASITTENDRRDTHLRSPDFFAADSFPTITFKSSKIVPGPNNSALVYGDLTIRGITKPVTLEANYLGSMANARMGGKIAGFDAKTTIDRKDFNVLWNRVLDQGGTMLGDDVAIELQVEASWTDPNAPARPQAPPPTPPPGEKK